MKLPVIKSPVTEGRETGTSRKLWNKYRKESVRALYTPFVVCLAAGNLRIDSFHHYISQDVHLLEAFHLAFIWAEDYVDEAEVKAAIAELKMTVLNELALHDSFVQEWGLEIMEEKPVNPATTEYTNFLLDTACGDIIGYNAQIFPTPFEKAKIAAYTIGTVTPCMRLFAFIGKEIQALQNATDRNLYKKWIDKYSSEDFEISAQYTEDLLDKMTVVMTGEELEIIENLYLKAMRLEIEFLTAQPLAQQTVIPLCKVLKPAECHLLLFSNFDLTCSAVDSFSVLAEISIQNQPENENPAMASTSEKGEKFEFDGLCKVLDEIEFDGLVKALDSPANLAEISIQKNAWDIISKEYADDHKQCIDIVLTTGKAQKFLFDGFCKAVSAGELLSDFDKKANAKVIGSRLLKGMKPEDIKKAGEHITLQDGCKSFLEKIVQNKDLNMNVHVLSYCWCGDLIRSAFSSGGLNGVHVHANEFIYDESISTGEITLKFQSPADKLQALNKIVEEIHDGKKKLVVCVGESLGDLLCLLNADVGIVMNSNESLRKVGSHFGISFVPLFQGLVKKQKEITEGSPLDWKGLSGILYTASSWAEIEAVILGCC